VKKKLVLLTVCVVAALSFAGCKKEEEIPEYVTTIGAEMEAELSSGQFYLDGDLYKFPITVGELRENGYYMGLNYKNEDTFTLPPGGQSDAFMMAKEVGDDGHQIWCKVFNPTEEELKLDECSIGYLLIDAPADMMFPGGIWSKSEHEDVIDVYGEPRDFKNDSDTFYDLWYDIEMEDGSKWEVKFRHNSWSVSDVTYTREGMEE